MRTNWLALAVILGTPLCSCGSSDADDGTFHWTISTAVDVDAPAERVWAVLADLPAYREWNPFIVDASGALEPGGTLSLRMALPGRSPMTIEPRVLVAEPGRELRWKGRLFVPGLFDGEHWFILTELPSGGTRVDHSERFSGLLLPIARSMIYDDTVASFRALNAALAERAAPSR